MAPELWRPAPNFEDFYEVSDFGNVRSLDRVVERLCRWGTPILERRKGRELKRSPRPDGHLVVTLTNGETQRQVFVHVLVLETFAGAKPEGSECRHLDGNPANNRLRNLAWGTRLENIADRKLLGEENPARGERSGRATLTESSVRYIRREAERGRSYASIGRDIGATRRAVRSVAIGRTWGWLSG